MTDWTDDTRSRAAMLLLTAAALVRRGWTRHAYKTITTDENGAPKESYCALGALDEAIKAQQSGLLYLHSVALYPLREIAGPQGVARWNDKAPDAEYVARGLEQAAIELDPSITEQVQKRRSERLTGVR